MNLAGKVALVAGGSVGIGRAISELLAAKGARVAIVSRTAAHGEAVVAAITAKGGAAGWFEGDFSDYANMRAAADRIAAAFGPVDILVASGGPEHPGPRLFLETDPADYAGFFQTKCSNRLIALRAVADQMIAKGKGKVVFLTTDGGRVPTPSEALVGAAAAGLIFATRAVGRELSRYGIRINTVSATITRDTGAWERFMAGVQGDSGETIVKAFKKVEARSPFGLNEPADIANAVLFFASDESDQISGATISVNGGLSFP